MAAILLRRCGFLVVRCGWFPVVPFGASGVIDRATMPGYEKRESLGAPLTMVVLGGGS